MAKADAQHRNALMDRLRHPGGGGVDPGVGIGDHGSRAGDNHPAHFQVIGQWLPRADIAVIDHLLTQFQPLADPVLVVAGYMIQGGELATGLENQNGTHG